MKWLSQLFIFCFPVFGFAAQSGEPMLAIGKTSVPTELEKSFSEKFAHDEVALKLRKWGQPTDGLRAALFTWVEPSTPRIHYVITIENVGTTPIENFPAATARAEAGWINRGMKKNVVQHQGTVASPLMPTHEILKPKDKIHLYLGASTCQSRFQFMNYRQVSASLTNGRTLNTATELLQIDGLKCTGDKETYKKTSAVAKRFDIQAFERRNEVPIEVDVSALPEHLQMEVNLPAVDFPAARATLTVRAPNGSVHKEEITIKFFETFCRGCDPVVGGGDNQCANRCALNRRDSVGIRALKLKQEFLYQEGRFTFEIGNFKPLCSSDCDAELTIEQNLCGHFKKCTSAKKPAAIKGEFEIRL